MAAESPCEAGRGRKVSRVSGPSAVTEDLDKFLLEVNPLSCFHRYPRTLTQFCKYKAFEYYVWLLYYSALILINFLPKKYFQNFMLLLSGIYLLNKEQVSKEDVNLAVKLLEAFLDDIKICIQQEIAHIICTNCGTLLFM